MALALGAAATINAVCHGPDVAGRTRGERWDRFFMLALDLQVLSGLLLYFGLSPYTREAMNDLRGVVGNPGLRFWTITHVAAMIVALLAVRMGRVLAMSGRTYRARQNGRSVCFGIALLAMVAGVPWPGLAFGRPLFRL
jgi:hypothetical protein